MRGDKSGVWPNTQSINEKLWVCHKRWRIRYTTKDESYWYNVLGRLIWRIYAKLGYESTRSLNAINCVEMTADLEYIKMVLGVWYKWKIVDIMRLRLDTRPKQRIISNNKALSRI